MKVVTLKWSIVTKSGKNGKISSIFNRSQSFKKFIALQIKKQQNVSI